MTEISISLFKGYRTCSLQWLLSIRIRKDDDERWKDDDERSNHHDYTAHHHLSDAAISGFPQRLYTHPDLNE